jgi:hypothetical protein
MRRLSRPRVCSRVLKDIIIWARMSHYTRVSADMAAYKSSALPHDKVTHFPPGPDAAWILTQRLQLLLLPPAWLALRFLHVAPTVPVAQVGAAFLPSAHFVTRDERSSGCFSLFPSSLVYVPNFLRYSRRCAGANLKYDSMGLIVVPTV